MHRAELHSRPCTSALCMCAACVHKPVLQMSVPLTVCQDGHDFFFRALLDEGVKQHDALVVEKAVPVHAIGKQGTTGSKTVLVERTGA